MPTSPSGRAEHGAKIERGRGYPHGGAARVVFEEQTRPIGRLLLDASLAGARRPY
jgi:hypothetical protein